MKKNTIDYVTTLGDKIGMTILAILTFVGAVTLIGLLLWSLGVFPNEEPHEINWEYSESKYLTEPEVLKLIEEAPLKKACAEKGGILKQEDVHAYAIKGKFIETRQYAKKVCEITKTESIKAKDLIK